MATMLELYASHSFRNKLDVWCLRFSVSQFSHVWGETRQSSMASRVLYFLFLFPEDFMRPVGVTLVGLYQILRGVIGLVFAFFILFYTGPANKLASVAAHGNVVERFLSGLGQGAGLIIIAFVVVHMLAGYGLLRMRNWGRFLTLLFSAIELLLMLPSIIHVNIFSLCFSVMNAGCIFYLIMPPIGHAFHAERNPMRAVG
jgi:hypothetical protein